MERKQLVILHMGMMKTASTYLQRVYWQRLTGNCGKPLDNKTADLTIRLDIIKQYLESSTANVKIISDEALLAGGVRHEKYKLEMLNYLGGVEVTPVVITQRPSNLLNSAISYFSQGRLFPNFSETARGLTNRFPKLLEYLNVPALENSLREIGTPIVLDISQIGNISSKLESGLGQKLEVKPSRDSGLESQKHVNWESLSRQFWTRTFYKKSGLYEKMPEANDVRELDSLYEAWLQRQNY